MRRPVLAALALVVTLIAAPAVLAADPGQKPGVRSQFYIFDGSSFEAGARVPGLELMNPRQAARFGRLLSLKKDLLSGMGSTLKERALK